MQIRGLSCAHSKYTTKLFYLIETHIRAGIVLQCYNDKVFIDKLDSTHHAEKGDVLYLLQYAMQQEAGGKTVYVSSKPSEYLFNDSERPMKTDGALIQWWLRAFDHLKATGSFYIPLAPKPPFDTALSFEPFEQYNFKGDGIDDPSKPWDAMTEHLGCFKVTLPPIVQDKKEKSNEEARIEEPPVHKASCTLPLVDSDTFQQIVHESRQQHKTGKDTPMTQVHIVSDMDAFRTTMKKAPAKRVQRLDGLVKRRKVNN